MSSNSAAFVRDNDGQLTIDPRLLARCDHLEFSLRFRDRQLRIHLDHDQERYRIDERDPLDVTIHSEQYRLQAGDTLSLPAVTGAR